MKTSSDICFPVVGIWIKIFQITKKKKLKVYCKQNIFKISHKYLIEFTIAHHSYANVAEITETLHMFE